MGVELLLDIIALIVRETQATIDTNSDTMINSILDMYNNDDNKWKRGNARTIRKLSQIIESLLETRALGEELDLGSLSRSLSLLLINDDDVADSDNGAIVKDIISTIINEVPSEVALKEISRLKTSISHIHAKEKLSKILARKNFELSKGEIDSGSVFGFIDESISELENIRASSVIGDEAVMGEIDLASSNLKEETEKSIIVKHVFKTGIQALNRMLQGGIRTSELTIGGALSHNYKTGFALTTWLGILLNNKPRPVKKKGDKPLAIWLSFEDDLINIIESLYRILYMTEEGEDPDLSTMSLEGIINVVKSRLQETGFSVKILRVNPTLWTYKDIFNKIAAYKSKGFETQILFVDYLDKLPMAGLGNGVNGSDKKDLLKRVNNHMSGLDIAFYSPWQLSSAANTLLKDGMSKKDLLSYIWDKSYYQGSSTLNTEIDLEIFTNKVAVPNNPRAKYWLNVHRGKHKLSSILKDEDDMSFYIPFPKQGMIPLDIVGDKVYDDISVKDPFTMGDNGAEGYTI